MTAKPRGIRRGTKPLGVVIAVGAALVLSGCSMLPGGAAAAMDGPASSGSPAAVEQGGTPRQAGEPVPAATTPAQDLAKKVQTSLTALGKVAGTPSRVQMRQAFITAGAAEEALELSLDKTPTGLAVDAVEGAAVVHQQCVVGQVRNGRATVTVLPVLATGRCFIGDQH